MGEQLVNGVILNILTVLFGIKNVIPFHFYSKFLNVMKTITYLQMSLLAEVEQKHNDIVIWKVNYNLN